jgi:UDP-N-acetylmuramate dehydrogenase
MDFIKENIPLAPLSSFKVGGNARFYLAPSSLQELQQGLQWAETKGRDVFILGAGTNLVFSDSGFNGLVIDTTKYMNHVQWNSNRITAEAGIMLSSVVDQSVKRGLSGIQKLAGIPGTIGGGVYINAGAFGQELGQSVARVRSCTTKGKIRERDRDGCIFGYRSSLYCERQEVIIEVDLELSPGKRDILMQEVEEILKKRKEKQPLEFPSAGSMFKRPPGQYAGSLIEQAGLKGYSRGGAMVSQKHANFIINTGNACAQDIYDLSEEIKDIIKKDRNIALDKEVRFIGDFLSWPR